MIKKLILKNFQSWSHLEVDFTQVNVILGETNTGKSAILRALGAVFYNNLDGASFVRVGHKYAEITVHTNDDVISLQKGSGVNRYILNDKIFDKISRGVPPEITEALQIEEVFFDDDTSLRLQFQSQLDAPFLLSDQGVKATRLLGTVSKVAVLYQAARLSSQKKKNQISTVAALAEVEHRAEERLNSFDYLVSLEPLVDRCNQLEAASENTGELKKAIGCGLTAIKEAKSHLCDITSEIHLNNTACHALKKLCHVRDEQSHLHQNLDFLMTYRQKETHLRSAISKAEATVRRHQRIVEIIREKDVIDDFLRLQAGKQTVKAKIRQAFEEVSKQDSVLKELERLYVCPVCGQEKK